MKTKIFNGKRITIRTLSKSDLKKAKRFQNFINSLIKEDAQILYNEKKSLREEINWLKNSLKQIKEKKGVRLVAEDKNIIVGITGITLFQGRQSHVGNLGIISIRKSYRGIGLGKYLMAEVIKLAKKELKPKPKIFRLSVYPKNKPAIGLYKKFGFKKVASIPRQAQYKGKLVDEVIMLRCLS